MQSVQVLRSYFQTRRSIITALVNLAAEVMASTSSPALPFKRVDNPVKGRGRNCDVPFGWPRRSPSSSPALGPSFWATEPRLVVV
jgi:hypothetical protein